MNKINYLDSKRLSRALIAGIRAVIARQDYLNDINVYPVPDRDTGTNLALTLNAIIERIYATHDTTIHSLLASAADAAIEGSRGNSGAIFAQFFVGLSLGAQSIDQEFTTSNFVVAIASAVNHAHKALSEPKEGTILTVMRDFSEAITAYQISQESTGFIRLLASGIERSEKSLANTVNQLKECRKANVVDAGAQGFVDFLHGIADFISTGSIKDLAYTPQDTASDEHVHDISHSIDEKYRYCTECLIHGDDIDQHLLREKLDPLGNSLIIAGTSTKTKIHIHTNDPGHLFDVCRQHGTLQGEKADDMIQQQHSTLKRHQGVVILTDSAADFPEGVIMDLNIHVVPLLITIGKQSYIDKISISPNEFHQAYRQSSHAATTSQPSLGDFKRQYEYLTSHYQSIIALHLPKHGSGTMNTSISAAKMVIKNNEVTVIDTKSVSGGQGLIVQYAAKAAQLGYKHDDIVKMTNLMITKTKQYAFVSDLSYAVRGGRIPQYKKIILDFFKATPIIAFDKNGRPYTFKIIRNNPNKLQKLANHIIKKLDDKKQYLIIIEHCDNVSDAETLLQLFKNSSVNIKQSHIVEASAALGVHAGPGALGVATQEYTEL